MTESNFSQYRITNFKRKRKFNDSQTNKLNDKDYKRMIMEDDYQSLTDSSSSNTVPQYSSHNDIKLEEFSIEGFSSDDSESVTSKITASSSVKVEAAHHSRKQLTPFKNDFSSECNDQDTFCIDMSRYRSFTSANCKNSLASTNYHNFDSPPMKIESPTPPTRFQRSRKTGRSNQVYKPHKHNKNVNATLIPCKGPACRSQICCAQYCSIKCYTNQIRPLGTGFMKTSARDYESVLHQEIDVTDYGLPYPDHTYCRDHKNIYFTPDSNIDSPPYCDLVEQLFYDEKEMRIKNPRPEPNINGDPISTNGYVSQAVRRGRPKRSTVVGLLDPYIFHPTTDVVYTPFLFRENILQADRRSSESCSERPIKDAIRKSSNLYKDVRSDVPPEIIYGSSHYSSSASALTSSDRFASSDRFTVKRERAESSMMDNIFNGAFSVMR